MKKILIFTFSVAVILGLVKILSIVPFDRMGADDFGFALVGFNQGILNAQLYWYLGITGRVTTNFLQTVFGMISSGNGVTSWFVILTIILMSLSLFVFFKNLLKSRVGVILTLLVSLVFLVSYYLITPNPSESWYWLTGSVTYLWPTFLGLGAIGFALNDKSNLWSETASFLLAFLAGFGNETFGFMFMTVLVCLLLYLRISKNKLFKNFLIVFAGAFISFLIMFFAPGNANRLKGGGSDEMSLMGTILYSMQKGPALLFSMVNENLTYLGSLFVSLSAFFSVLNISVDPGADREKLLKKLFFIFTIPVILSVIFMIPGYKALGRVPPDRTEVNLSLAILLTVIFGALYLAQLIGKLNLSKYFAYQVVIAVFTLTFFITATSVFTKTIAEDVYIAKDYSSAFDNLFAQLKRESAINKNQVVIVEPLPESGLIHSQILTSDTQHWANSYWSSFFGLKGVKIADVKK